MSVSDLRPPRRLFRGMIAFSSTGDSLDLFESSFLHEPFFGARPYVWTVLQALVDQPQKQLV